MAVAVSEGKNQYHYTHDTTTILCFIYTAFALNGIPSMTPNWNQNTFNLSGSIPLSLSLGVCVNSDLGLIKANNRIANSADALRLSPIHTAHTTHTHTHTKSKGVNARRRRPMQMSMRRYGHRTLLRLCMCERACVQNTFEPPASVRHIEIFIFPFLSRVYSIDDSVLSSVVHAVL